MSDQEERMSLGPVDPGWKNPGYWLGFHSRVMNLAREELARRRMVADLTVAEVVFAWRKALVPSALLAAALAGIFVLAHEEPAEPLPPLALEQALVEGLGVEPIPTVLGREAELDEVAFLMEAGGF